MSDRVTVSVDAGVADVRLNRPEKRNALDGAMFLALAEAGERLKTEPGLRCVVLSGEGRLVLRRPRLRLVPADGRRRRPRRRPGERPAGNPASMADGRITHLGQQVAWVWQEVPVPVIAAVHGHALGGGIQIALGADIRIVHPDAQLSVREVHWGLVPDMTGTLTLSRLVRPDVAKELTFTATDGVGVRGRSPSAWPPGSRETPREDALALAAEIAARSPEAVRGAKALFNRLLGAGGRPSSSPRSAGSSAA